MTHEPLHCTDPEHFEHVPDVDAPSEVILAWLRHCDECRFHAAQNLEDDLGMDVLLRAATRDLEVRPRLRRRDRRPIGRPRFERRLAWACVAACCIIVAWPAVVERVSTGSDDVVALAVPEEAEKPLDVLSISETRAGHLYLARRAQEAELPPTQPAGGAFTIVSVVASIESGTVLRIVNPENGRWLEAHVAQRSYGQRELLLPSAVADSLGVEASRVVFVEVVRSPPSVGLAP